MSQVKKFEYVIEDHRLDDIDFKFASWKHPASGEITFDQGIFDFTKSYLNPGDIVIDVGTHVGIETMMYALAVGKEGKVYGFEPNPYVFESFEKTCELNKDIVNIIPIMKAITEENGTYTFHYSDAAYCNGGFASETDAGVGACGHSHPIEVEGVNFLDWLRENAPNDITKIKLFKTDTEGYDLQILKSVRLFLSIVRPIIQSELFYSLSDDEIQNQLQFLDDLDYANFYFPEEWQSAIGSIDIYSVPIAYEMFTAEHWTYVKRMCKGKNLISIPKEKVKT